MKMIRKHKIQKLIAVGDFVYSANNGKPMKIKEINSVDFYTEEDFFTYDEHSKLYFLTERGYKTSIIEKEGKLNAIKK